MEGNKDRQPHPHSLCFNSYKSLLPLINELSSSGINLCNSHRFISFHKQCPNPSRAHFLCSLCSLLFSISKLFHSVMENLIKSISHFLKVCEVHVSVITNQLWHQSLGYLCQVLIINV